MTKIDTSMKILIAIFFTVMFGVIIYAAYDNYKNPVKRIGSKADDPRYNRRYHEVNNRRLYQSGA